MQNPKMLGRFVLYSCLVPNAFLSFFCCRNIQESFVFWSSHFHSNIWPLHAAIDSSALKCCRRCQFIHMHPGINKFILCVVVVSRIADIQTVQHNKIHRTCSWSANPRAHNARWMRINPKYGPVTFEIPEVQQEPSIWMLRSGFTWNFGLQGWQHHERLLHLNPTNEMWQLPDSYHRIQHDKRRMNYLFCLCQWGAWCRNAFRNKQSRHETHACP